MGRLAAVCSIYSATKQAQNAGKLKQCGDVVGFHFEVDSGLLAPYLDVQEVVEDRSDDSLVHRADVVAAVIEGHAQLP